jgi:hypothetical protein
VGAPQTDREFNTETENRTPAGEIVKGSTVSYLYLRLSNTSCQ